MDQYFIYDYIVVDNFDITPIIFTINFDSIDL